VEGCRNLFLDKEAVFPTRKATREFQTKEPQATVSFLMSKMGRRALRKIDPDLDLSGYLIPLAELPQPWDQTILFDRRAALEVEVGTGKGLFLRQAAAACAQHDFLGIEISRKYARFAAARLAKLGVPNALIVLGDALRVFADYLPDQSVNVVHVYFPDPWWKKRHAKRRLIRPSFVRDVSRVLMEGGRLHFWTDVEWYFQESVELIVAQGHLLGPVVEPEAEPRHQLDFRTHFERRMRLSGEPVFRAMFFKPAGQVGSTSDSSGSQITFENVEFCKNTRSLPGSQPS